MADPILKRLYEYPLASIFNGVFAQDKLGGITESVGPDQVFAALDAEGFARDIDLPAPSSEMPQDLGTASSGSGDDYSRADHRHKKPSLADLGAAAVSHNHTTAQVTGLDTALAAKEPSLGNPGGTTPLWLRTIAGVRAWVQLVAADITDLSTALAAYLTKNNPTFTGLLTGPQAKIGDASGASSFVMRLKAADHCQQLNQTTGTSKTAAYLVSTPVSIWAWGAMDTGLSGAPVGCWAINDAFEARVWGTAAGMWIRGALDFTGALSQGGTQRITSGGGFRGVDLKLTGLVAGAGKMTRIGADGAVEAATNPDPKGYASVGGNAGTVSSAAFASVLGGPQIVAGDWVDGASFELKGVIRSDSGGAFELRFSVGSLATPVIVMPANTVYVDVEVRVLVTGTNAQLTYKATRVASGGEVYAKAGTSTGACGSGPEYAIVTEVKPSVTQDFSTANIAHRRTT